MISPIELVPMYCIQCSARIPANPNEYAWRCSECGQGQRLAATDELVPCEIHFHADLEEGQPGFPYWVLRGQVEIHRTVAKPKADESEKAAEFWSRPHTFFVPAFECTLDEMIYRGGKLLMVPPGLESGSATSFHPVTLPMDDSLQLIDFLVAVIEADRSDALKRLQVTKNLSSPELWIIPS
jgi:hypothetical protein